MADHKDDDLGRVIDELSRARAEADDYDRLPPTPDDDASVGPGTKGERYYYSSEANGVAPSNAGWHGVPNHGGPNDTQGSDQDTSPLTDPWVLGFAGMGIIIMTVRLLHYFQG